MEEKRIANMLYHAYERMYNVSPDLTGDQTDLTVMFQTMAYFLNQYGVSFMDASFVREGYTDLDMPMSMEIQDILVNYVFGHSKDEFAEQVSFNDHALRVIETLSRELGFIKAPWGLKMVTKIHFFENRVLPSGSKEEVSKAANVSIDVYNSYREFIENVVADLAKDNFDQNNLASVDRSIEESQELVESYRPILNEEGTGDTPVIKEASRKNAVRALLR